MDKNEYNGKSGKEILHRFKYSEKSPTGLVWDVQVFRKPNDIVPLRDIGEVAGYIRKDGYAGVTVSGFGEFMCHRLIWEMYNGEIPAGLYVDHIDGDRLNNSISNMRLVSWELNIRNTKMPTTNTSGVTGVSYDDKGNSQYWKAKWRVNNSSKTKCFCIKTLGYEKAFRLACEYRKKMIDELNIAGAGYTERHGK